MQLAARKEWGGALWVMPAFAFVVLFFVVPLVMCVVMSFYTWPLFGDNKFVAFRNYTSLFADEQLLRSFCFTLLYTVLITPVIFIVAMALALMVNRPGMAFLGFYRTAFFLPVVIGVSTSSLLWIWMLNDSVGVFNGILLSLGLIHQPIIWLGELKLALPSVIVSILWKTAGFSMILLLGGLQSIPGEIYEAARIDGCSASSSFRMITLPLMKRTIAVTLLLSVIGSLLAFDQFYIMTSGRPANASVTIVYWIYINSFQKFRLGYGSAMSLAYLILLLGFCTLQLKSLSLNQE
ncbi:MAG: sugar ABC transporter permease [Rectinemataceae bacterium]|jgi:multiple sugar transport system permease protein